jgi:uncharacterized protein YecT (DUF1311 family)
VAAVVVLSLGFGGRPARAGETQADMNDEAAGRLKAADADLKRTLDALIASAKGDSDAIAAVRRSESAWEAYRDGQVRAMWPSRDPSAYGTVHAMCVADAKAELTRLRVRELRAMLEPTEGDVCAPGWPP